MAKIDLRDELLSYKFELGLLQKIPCSKEENKAYKQILKEGGHLPDGVFAFTNTDGSVSTTEFYTVFETDLTEQEKNDLIVYRKLSLLNTIKNCVVFFTTITVIGIIAGVCIAFSI